MYSPVTGKFIVSANGLFARQFVDQETCDVLNNTRIIVFIKILKIQIEIWFKYKHGYILLYKDEKQEATITLTNTVCR